MELDKDIRVEAPRPNTSGFRRGRKSRRHMCIPFILPSRGSILPWSSSLGRPSTNAHAA